MELTTCDIYPALTVSVEEILVTSNVGLVWREDGPGVEVKIAWQCGEMAIKVCFLSGLHPLNRMESNSFLN